ncbi:MAG: TonB-dependent receptor [Cyclobacteriaceae bacterium]|nr:TonB-dependent receptor [Cyclobacteriaceae bacterium]
MLALVICSSYIGYSQSSAGFIVTGRIIDEQSKEPLPGATVIVQGTNLGSSSDLNGYFSISNVKPGKNVLQVSFIGYTTKDVSVEVSGNTNVPNIVLQPSLTSLTEIVVVGFIDGQQKALNQQRSADNIKNVVSSDVIGRFPDLNVAEALQRVPGVNITRSRGEGSTVSLRGTPAHFTTVNINGEQIPSTQDNGARNESLDLIPADQLASMEITKAITPDMDGDAIGGSVNLLTPVAKNKDLSVRAEAGLGYNAMSQGYNGIGRLKVGQRFLANQKMPDGRLGVIIGASYFGNDNEEDSYQAVWSGTASTPIINLGIDTVVIENYNYADLINQRQRYGATATIDYKFSSTSSIIFNAIYSRRQDFDQRNRIFGILNESAGIQWQTLDSLTGAELRRDILVRDYYSENLSLNLSGNHSINKLIVDWAVFYSPSKRVEENYGGRFVRGSSNRINLRVTNPNGIFSDFLRFESTSPGLNYYDPFIINEIDRYETNSILLKSDNGVAKINLQYSYKVGEAEGLLKGGFKYRKQSNQREQDASLYNFSDPNEVLIEEAAFASVVGNFEDQDFMNNQVRFGPSIDRNKFSAFYSQYNRLFVLDPIASPRNSLFGTYKADETITAAYLMTRLRWNKLMVLAGLRYEDNLVEYDAFKVNNVTGTGTPFSDGTQYGFVLPNIHLRYSFDKFSNLRFAFTQSYARANFNDLIPFLRIDEAGSNLVAGNAELKPAFSTNFDLLYEKYLPSVGILSGGIFYKSIDDFQFQRNLPFLQPGDPFYEEFPGYSFRQPQNGENAIVYGLEVNVQAPLDFLPGILGGFGVYFNYTFTESDAFTADRSNIKLPGQARHTWNGALSFEHKKFTIRGMVNYNGEFLTAVAGEANNDIVQVDRMQVDITSAYAFSKRFRVFAEFMNIINAPSIRYQGSRERLAQYAYFGWWNRFGLTYSF